MWTIAKKISVSIMALVMVVTFTPMFEQTAFAKTGSGNAVQTAAQGQYVLSDDTTDIWVDDLTYNGQKQIPEVEVEYYWEPLTQDQDYTLRFIDSNGNTISADEGICNAGQYLMTVTGIGDYTGTVTKTVRMKTASISSVEVNQKAVTYNGRKRYKTITVKAKLNGTVRTLKKGTDYTVAYKNNKYVGKATITIKGKGNYRGTFKRTFKIKPRATWIRSLKPQPFGFKAKWAKKTTQVSGYQIQYSRKSSFSTRKTITIKSNKTIRRSFKNLKGGKKYYVRVRTYKKVNGTKYFSKWSKKKTVKTIGWKKISFKKVKKYTKGHLTKRQLTDVFTAIIDYRSHKNSYKKKIKRLGHKWTIRQIALSNTMGNDSKLSISTANKKLSFFTDFRYKKNHKYGEHKTDSRWVHGAGFGIYTKVKVTSAKKCGNKIRIWFKEYVANLEENNYYEGPSYMATLKRSSSGGYYLYKIKKMHTISASRYNYLKGRWGPWINSYGDYTYLKFTRDRVKIYYSHEKGGELWFGYSEPIWWSLKKKNGTIVYYCDFYEGDYFVLSKDRKYLTWHDE